MVKNLIDYSKDDSSKLETETIMAAQLAPSQKNLKFFECKYLLFSQALVVGQERPSPRKYFRFENYYVRSAIIKGQIIPKNSSFAQKIELISANFEIHIKNEISSITKQSAQLSMIKTLAPDDIFSGNLQGFNLYVQDIGYKVS